MADLPQLALASVPLLIFADAKAGPCDLNASWIGKSPRNLELLLRSIGLHRESEVEHSASNLYGTGGASSESGLTRLSSVGRRRNPVLAKSHPQCLQFTWEDDVLPFMWQRFLDFRAQKRHAPQWDNTGRELYKRSRKLITFHEFAADVIRDLVP
jgi:hypothetical protein